MQTLLCEFIDLFKRSLAFECFLLTNLTITRFLLLVLTRAYGFKSIPDSLQMPITFFSRFSSDTLLEVPDISTLFLLLYCSFFCCCFSSSVTLITSRVLALETTNSWLLIFPFFPMFITVTFHHKLFHGGIKSNLSFEIFDVVNQIFLFHCVDLIIA